MKNLFSVLFCASMFIVASCGQKVEEQAATETPVEQTTAEVTEETPVEAEAVATETPATEEVAK